MVLKWLTDFFAGAITEPEKRRDQRQLPALPPPPLGVTTRIER